MDARALIRWALLPWAIIAITAILVRAAGYHDVLASRLDYTFETSQWTAEQELHVLANNLRAILPLFALGELRSHIAAPRLLAVVVIALNTIPVGVALGAYGLRAIPWLTHLPLELAALTAGGLAATTQQPLPRRCGNAGIAAGLLIIASSLEASIWP